MPETSSGMQAEARSRGARTPSGAKPRASRGVRKNAAAGGCWGGRDPREDRSNGFSSTTNRTNFHEWGAAAPSYSRVGTARFLASQDSGAQRLSCWMQWRPCRVSGSSQPKPRVGRRTHIADGPEGAASRGASKAKVDQVFTH